MNWDPNAEAVSLIVPMIPDPLRMSFMAEGGPSG